MFALKHMLFAVGEKFSCSVLFKMLKGMYFVLLVGVLTVNISAKFVRPARDPEPPGTCFDEFPLCGRRDQSEQCVNMGNATAKSLCTHFGGVCLSTHNPHWEQVGCSMPGCGCFKKRQVGGYSVFESFEDNAARE